jgi:hypothetical protein
MKKIAIVFLIFFSPKLTLAKKNLSAHVHGVVSLDVASDKKQLLVMLNTPSESFLGFEYKARTKAEKDVVLQVKNEWIMGLISYLGTDVLKDCKVSKSKWEQHFESKVHSRIEAEAYIDCNNILAGRTLSITFSSKHKSINVIHLQLLRENGTVLSKKFNKDFEVKL